MGIVISSGIRTSPFSVTSTIIGFVSFTFTVATFLRIVWTNLETMSEAPHEVHGYLTNLRTELLEEQNSLRVMRRESKKFRRDNRRRHNGVRMPGMELDDVTLKTMHDMIRHLIRQFEHIERPFLEPGTEGIGAWKQRAKRRGSSVSPYYGHSAYASPPREKSGGVGRRGSRRQRGREVEVEDDEEDDDDKYWAQRVKYAKFTLRKRFAWVWKKSDAQALFETLTRVQVRRTARQVGGLAFLMHDYGERVCNIEAMVSRMDERLGNIVGVRRVDD